MLMELTELIAYGTVLISEQKKVYLHNRFIRYELVRFLSLSVRTSVNKERKKKGPWTEASGSATLENKQTNKRQNKQKKKKKTNHKDDKKSMKPKILLIFIFPISHEVVLGFFCFGLVWGFCLV